MSRATHDEAVEPTHSGTDGVAVGRNAAAGVASDHGAESVTPASKKRLWWIAGGAGVLVAIVGIGAVLSGVFSAAETAPPVETPPVVMTPHASPTEETTDEPDAEPLPDPVVTISDVLQMPYSEVWRPADEGQSYWQIVDEAYGYPADGGTDYLLAHSCENRACAGDDLLTLDAGKTLEYQGSQYLVERRWTAMKDDIGAQDIWEHDPNRLVIVTCVIETTWEASDKNEIFVATRVS